MCGESPPTAENIDAWLRERTPNKQQYAKGRALYRESISDAARETTKNNSAADPNDLPAETDNQDG